MLESSLIGVLKIHTYTYMVIMDISKLRKIQHKLWISHNKILIFNYFYLSTNTENHKLYVEFIEISF